MSASTELDPTFVSLLADPRVTLRPPPPSLSMKDYRQRLDRPMAAVAGPAIWSVRSDETEAIRRRIYRPTAQTHGTILFFHGGGFVVGSLDTHDALCRSLAAASGASVVAVEYRLAPEAPFPAACDDCRSALQRVAGIEPGDIGKLAVCGDSAGGYLAAMTALYAARQGIRIDALGLFYPVVAPACETESWRTLGADHMLTRDWMRWAWASYLGDAGSLAADVDLLRADLASLPPTHIITAAFDPLRDEGEALGAAIRTSGGVVTMTRYEGMIHGFASLPMLTPMADRAITEMGRKLFVNNSVD